MEWKAYSFHWTLFLTSSQMLLFWNQRSGLIQIMTLGYNRPKESYWVLGVAYHFIIFSK